MRIGSISQVSQIYQTTAKPKNSKSSFESQMDVYSVSSNGKDYQIAKKAVSETPDIRQDKVDSLKQKISGGSYDVSAEDFAAHLLAAYNNKTV